MDINTTITDDQAAALATALRVKKYADGNDLIQQGALLATVQAQRTFLVQHLMQQSDPAVLASVTTSLGPVNFVLGPAATPAS